MKIILGIIFIAIGIVLEIIFAKSVGSFDPEDDVYLIVVFCCALFSFLIGIGILLIS